MLLHRVHSYDRAVSILTVSILLLTTTHLLAGNGRAAPDVLVIGDSISIGYDKPLRELLAGNAVKRK